MSARLRSGSDHAVVARRGHRAEYGPILVYVVLPATPASARLTSTASARPRVGFVVSRRVGGAVGRNRVRRRLRHLAAARLDRLPPGSAVVVRATPPAAELSSAELATALDAAITAALTRFTRDDRPRSGHPAVKASG